MPIRIFLDKSVQENAAFYHEAAKKARKKAEGVVEAIGTTKKKIRKLEKEGAKKKEGKKVRVVREREWYEGFGWSFTNSGKLALFGRNAKQNDLVVARHFEEKDLFFHAEITGGSVVILKEGVGASAEELDFCARLAASFSKAWVKGLSQVDAYCVGREQVGKHTSGGSIGQGGFAISGKRNWFRNTPLRLRVGVDSKGRGAVGAPDADYMEKSVVVAPGKKAKGETGKEIGKILGVDEAEIVHILPSGSFSIIKE